ncbi:hypothetical protein [uncultured Gammaproteobacteria bacterium]|nr:hypothetical protein [uncultured Gammaproteobacteria bacterium]CAC9996558.1 hypothetical protein [uncultured Gammaproteobacteria bacterium]
MWCWIKSSFVDLDGWKNGWFWFVWSEFLRGDYVIECFKYSSAIRRGKDAVLKPIKAIPLWEYN